MSDQPPKLLKMTVISMGIMLIGGFLWVGAVIAQRAGETAVAVTQIAPRAVKDCPEIALPKLPEAQISFADDQWLIVTPSEVLRLSKCGELVQRATLK